MQPFFSDACCAAFFRSKKASILYTLFIFYYIGLFCVHCILYAIYILLYRLIVYIWCILYPIFYYIDLFYMYCILYIIHILLHRPILCHYAISKVSIRSRVFLCLLTEGDPPSETSKDPTHSVLFRNTL